MAGSWTERTLTEPFWPTLPSWVLGLDLLLAGNGTASFSLHTGWAHLLQLSPTAAPTFRAQERKSGERVPSGSPAIQTE